MNAEGRILTAARWISGANGTLGGAAGATGLGYGKSRWQRATEANRAVEYAIKGVVMALDGRVNQRHNSRELAHHLQRRGEDVGMAQLDDVEPQKGRTPTRTRSSRTPSSRTSATNRRRGSCAPLRRLSATANDGSKRSRVSTTSRWNSGCQRKAGARPPTSGKNSRGARRAASLSATGQESRSRHRTGPKTRRKGVAQTARSAKARRGTTTPMAEAVGRTHSEAGGGPAGYLARLDAASGESEGVGVR